MRSPAFLGSLITPATAAPTPSLVYFGATGFAIMQLQGLAGADAFVPAANYKITTLEVGLACFSPSSGQVRAHIMGTTGGTLPFGVGYVPTGVSLGASNGTFNLATVVSTGWDAQQTFPCTFNFSSANISVLANTVYAVVLVAESFGGVAWGANIKSLGSADWPTVGHRICKTTNNITNWSSVGVYDSYGLHFNLYGTPN
jgi:hypothetical protein